MAETTTIEIPLAQFDLSLLPEEARDTGTEAFRDAVAAFFRNELRQAAEWIQVGVDAATIKVSWRTKSGAPDLFAFAIQRLQAGDYATGIRLLRLVLRVRPDDAAVLQNLGMALSDQGQLDEAILLLRRATELNPSSANAQVALGVAYSRKGDAQESLKALESAVQIDPENPYALRNLGGSLFKLGQELPRAERCFRQAVVALPNDQLGWLGLGQVLEAQERLDDADQVYRRALELNPHSELAESVKHGRSRIAQLNMRKAAVGGLRMDGVMYCAGALEKIASMSDREVEKIAMEIATVGMNGINPNDSNKRYRLKSLEGEFSGLQLLSYMYVTWKRFKPDADIGFDLSREYAAALGMQKRA